MRRICAGAVRAFIAFGASSEFRFFEPAGSGLLEPPGSRRYEHSRSRFLHNHQANKTDEDEAPARDDSESEGCHGESEGNE